MREKIRFLARLLLLPHLILNDFVRLDILPTWKGLKQYLFDDYMEGRYLAQRKAGL